MVSFVSELFYPFFLLNDKLWSAGEILWFLVYVFLVNLESDVMSLVFQVGVWLSYCSVSDFFLHTGLLKSIVFLLVSFEGL